MKSSRHFVGHVADNFSVCFGLCHFAADQNQNVKMSFWLVAVKMSGTSRRRIKIAKCKLGPWYNVADIFSATLPKIRSAFCAFEPSQQRGVQNAPHGKRVRASIWRSKLCVIAITPSHNTLIHHKRASRYVVLGKISHSPFTTYIFVKSSELFQHSFFIFLHKE